MKLILHREQRKSVLGKAIFSLSVRAETTAEERAAIAEYKLGPSVLYEKNTLIDRGSGLLGLASRLAHHALNISVSVNDLANGKVVECKDIVEMLAVEETIREAGKLFNQVLRAAKHFGGDEVVDLAA